MPILFPPAMSVETRLPTIMASSGSTLIAFSAARKIFPSGLLQPTSTDVTITSKYFSQSIFFKATRTCSSRDVTVFVITPSLRPRRRNSDKTSSKWGSFCIAVASQRCPCTLVSTIKVSPKSKKTARIRVEFSSRLYAGTNTYSFECMLMSAKLPTGVGDVSLFSHKLKTLEANGFVFDLFFQAGISAKHEHLLQQAR